MKVELICIGKTADKYLIEGESIFEKRLERYIKFKKIELPDVKNAAKMPSEELKKKEGEVILKQLDARAFVVILDENGKHLTSREMATKFENWGVQGYSHIQFVVGGAFGFSKVVMQKANFMLSLSKMTFSHQMVRLFCLEQIYRAQTIIRNEPYHND